MSVLNRGGVARYPEWTRPNELSLKVTVQDDVVRSQVDGFDGMERAFALVPMRDGEWKNFALAYAGDFRDRSGIRYDVHQLSVTAADGIDVDKVQQEGVAFGIDTNKGTLYAQAFGDNFRPWPLDR